MPVFRVEKNGNYTVMSNYHLDDERLSLKAIGLLSKMLRLPDGWDYTIVGLAAICKDGKAAIQTALKELEDCGYIKRSQSHSETGNFSGYDYVVYEKPESVPPCTENRYTVKIPENPPCTDFPYTGFPYTENRPQINTNINNIPPIVPQRGTSKRKPKETAEWKPERFEGFWSFYPIHTSRQAAIRAWDRLKPSDQQIDDIAKALMRQKDSELWQRGIGIPYASTYLNNQRWTDSTDLTPVGCHVEDGDVLRI